MRNALLLLAVALLVVGGLTASPYCPGQAVGYGEAERATGACAEYGPVAVWVCYGGNCQSGGCGCARIQQIVNGNYKPAAATACASSYYCTAPQSVTTQPCMSYAAQ